MTTLTQDQQNVLNGYKIMQGQNGGTAGILAEETTISAENVAQQTTLINANVVAVQAFANKNISQLTSQIANFQTQLATWQSVETSCANVQAVNAQVAAAIPPA